MSNVFKLNGRTLKFSIFYILIKQAVFVFTSRNLNDKFHGIFSRIMLLKHFDNPYIFFFFYDYSSKTGQSQLRFSHDIGTPITP